MSCEQDHSLPHEERLRNRGAVSQLFAEGESGFVFPLRYVVRRVESGADSMPSVLFTVPKRMHKRANKRNLLRRRMKEAYRLNKQGLSGGLNIALIYATKEIHDYSKIERSVKKIIAAVAEKG